MLRSLGSRSELALRRKHRTVRRLWHSRTKFNPWQHHRPREHCHTAGRHKSDNPRFDITEWNLSECNNPWVYLAQRGAWRYNAGINEPRLDIAERHAEYDNPWINITERHAQYDHSGLDFAQRDTEYNDPGIYFANWDAEYDSRFHFAANHTSG
jgi:hypothetical protein